MQSAVDILLMLLYGACRQLDYQSCVVGLNFCFVSRLITYHGAASVTLVYDDVSLFGVRLGLYRTEYSAAIVSSVTWVDINVQRAEAEGTVVS